MEIKIVHFYPELLNLYGDRGNIAALKKRCEWRGIDAEVIEYGINDDIDLSDKDIVLIGGGADKEQLMVRDALLKQKDKLSEYIENDGVLIALCSSYYILGSYFERDNIKYDGLNLFDFHTINGKKRMISNIIINTEWGQIPGFENHTMKTYINSMKPFGNVINGFGNNGEDGSEGVVYKNLIASNLHGPLLPKNPVLADAIIKKALCRKYGKVVALDELDDTIEFAAHNYIVNRFCKD